MAVARLDQDALRAELEELVKYDGASVARLRHASTLQEAVGVDSPEALKKWLITFFAGRSGNLGALGNSLNLDDDNVGANTRRAAYAGTIARGKDWERKGIGEFIKLLMEGGATTERSGVLGVGSGPPSYFPSANAVLLTSPKGWRPLKVALTLRIDEEMCCRAVSGNVHEAKETAGERTSNTFRKFEVETRAAPPGYIVIDPFMFGAVEDLQVRLIFSRDPRVSFLRARDLSSGLFQHDSRDADPIHTYRVMSPARYSKSFGSGYIGWSLGEPAFAIDEARLLHRVLVVGNLTRLEVHWTDAVGS